MKLIDECLDGSFIAFEIIPLTDALRSNQSSLQQRRQVRRYGRLRQVAAAIDQAGADTHAERVLLFGKKYLGLFQPRQDLAAHRIGEGFMYGVYIHVNYMYRVLPISISSYYDIKENRAGGRKIIYVT